MNIYERVQLFLEITDKQAKIIAKGGSVHKGQSQSALPRVSRYLKSLVSPKAARRRGRTQARQSIARKHAPGISYTRVQTQKLKARRTATKAGVAYKDLPHGSVEDILEPKPKIIPRSKRYN